MKRLRTLLLATSCLAAFVAGSAVQAADLPQGYGGLPEYGKAAAPGTLPAVSQVNGKLSAFGGSQDGGIFGVTGALSVPLGHAYGLQLDGMVGSGKSAAFYGVGGHVFWRDPTKGLLGIYSSYVNWDLSGGSGGFIGGAAVGKIGAEGEAYLGRFTLEGRATYQFGDFKGFAGRALFAYYPTDNFRVDGGARYLKGIGAIGMVDVEWQPRATSGLSLFATGSFGENSYSQVLGGARFYFGATGKSLIRRHREDDPGTTLQHDLINSGQCPSGTTYVPAGEGPAYCASRRVEN